MYISINILTHGSQLSLLPDVAPPYFSPPDTIPKPWPEAGGRFFKLRVSLLNLPTDWPRLAFHSVRCSRPWRAAEGRPARTVHNSFRPHRVSERPFGFRTGRQLHYVPRQGDDSTSEPCFLSRPAFGGPLFLVYIYLCILHLPFQHHIYIYIYIYVIGRTVISPTVCCSWKSYMFVTCS